MRIRIQLFISLRIQIRNGGAKPMRIYADPDLGETLKTQNVQFFIKNILTPKIGQKTYQRRYESLFESQETRFICLFVVIVDAPGSVYAFPIGSGSGTQDQEYTSRIIFFKKLSKNFWF
jgi:hypothetical protein